MSRLVAMFCDIDDFCKVFKSVDTQNQLPGGLRQRRYQSQLGLRKVMTIIVSLRLLSVTDAL